MPAAVVASALQTGGPSSKGTCPGEELGLGFVGLWNKEEEHLRTLTNQQTLPTGGCASILSVRARWVKEGLTLGAGRASVGEESIRRSAGLKFVLRHLGTRYL